MNAKDVPTITSSESNGNQRLLHVHMMMWFVFTWKHNRMKIETSENTGVSSGLFCNVDRHRWWPLEFKAPRFVAWLFLSALVYPSLISHTPVVWAIYDYSYVQRCFPPPGHVICMLKYLVINFAPLVWMGIVINENITCQNVLPEILLVIVVKNCGLQWNK